MHGENFSIAALKRIAYDSLRRQWNYKSRQEQQLRAQEEAIVRTVERLSKEEKHRNELDLNSPFMGFIRALQEENKTLADELARSRQDLSNLKRNLSQKEKDSKLDEKIAALDDDIRGEVVLYVLYVEYLHCCLIIHLISILIYLISIRSLSYDIEVKSDLVLRIAFEKNYTLGLQHRVETKEKRQVQ